MGSGSSVVVITGLPQELVTITTDYTCELFLINKYLNKFANELVIFVAFKMKPRCNHFIQVGLFICTSNVHNFLNLFSNDLLHHLQPFLPLQDFFSQCSILHLEQSVVQK